MWLAGLRLHGPCRSERQVRALHTHTCTQYKYFSFPCLPLPSAIAAVSASSSQGRTPDRDIMLPLLVAPSVGGEVTLFAVVAADPCPTIQWMRNGTRISNGGNYRIVNPCPSAPAGTPSYNFTLTITANTATTGIYTATITNAAGTVNVPSVFVTPPGMLALLGKQLIILTLLVFLVPFSSSDHY